jgi:type IV pilus assembly protein PilN
MIRINLLAFRAARKRESVRKQFSIYFLTVIFLLVLMPLIYLMLNNNLSTLKQEEKQLRGELASYDKVTREIARIKSKTAEIEKRLNIIKELEKQRSGPVKLLEEVALSVPADRLWLRSIVESGGVLNLEGNAMDNDTVALFMTNLEKTGLIQSVDLKSTKVQNFPTYKIDAANFALTCRLASQKESPKPEARPKKGN